MLHFPCFTWTPYWHSGRAAIVGRGHAEDSSTASTIFAKLLSGSTSRRTRALLFLENPGPRRAAAALAGIGGAVRGGSAILRSFTGAPPNVHQEARPESAGRARTGNVTPPQPQRRTKQSLLLELIGREGGATLEELTSVTEWLPHTVRAAISGLRKRGHGVRCERIDGVSRYIVGNSNQ